MIFQRTILLFMMLLYMTGNKAMAFTILFLGDSITEGLGVEKEEAFPELVKSLFREKLKKEIEVINAGVSGSTTASGLERLLWFTKKKPDALFLALGANDGLRGLDVEQSKKNLIKIIEAAQTKEIKVYLAGMKVPPNYGKKYASEFEKIFSQIKILKKVELMPFLLKDVAGEKKYNLVDGIHPNPAGHKVISRNVFNFLKDKI